ncbi:hypothetical protein [Jiulongibacter sediminis]|uniref:hypothetical protein n=1 Tax=Jiulongibacter sediminis TaxID=1605367 RepID=UPI0026EF7CCD|nr:hypothetical protein [Jiulongibacter sediminis]
MKTPLFFKLLLMLAIGLRLIYAARKSKKTETKPYQSLTDYPSRPFQSPEGLDQNYCPGEQLKYIYRKSVRGSMDSRLKVMIFLAIELEKSNQKGSLYRFLWYRNEWTYVFYQALIAVNFTEWAHQLSEAMEELTGYNFQNINIQATQPESLFPNAQIDSEKWKTFNRSFSLKDFQLALLKEINL